MKLITETVEEVRYLTEVAEDTGKKSYFIEGVFMQADKKNKNGRMYPLETLSKEVKRYNKNFVKTSRAMGELGHPEGPSINLERVSHMIKELSEDGSSIVGKAKVLDTPYGKIVQNLIDEGAKLGVSSRGMGSLEKNDKGINVVQEDFMLATVDIVADPSAPGAFVNGIMEGKEWVWNNGIFEEKELEESVRILTRADKRQIADAQVAIFKKFLSRL